MHTRQKKTFEKNLEKDLTLAKTAFKNSGHVSLPVNQMPGSGRKSGWRITLATGSVNSISTPSPGKLRRSGDGQKATNRLFSYRIDAEIELDPEAVEGERQELGGFVLATSDTGISADELLANYKGQGAVERGFRFLKDKSFRVAGVFLKKTPRIQVLAMIMVLCLFIYSITEFRLRKGLERSGETVTSQTKKQTQRPTMKWMFFRFRRVRKFVVIEDGRRMKRVTNLDEELRKILRLLGAEYEKYYS